MKIVYRTNLDIEGEYWPVYLDYVPEVGTYVVSETVRNGRSVRLKVIGVTVHADKISVELHLPDNFKCVSHFEAWYDFIRGNISQDTYERRTKDALDKCCYGAQWKAADDGTITNGRGYVCKAVSKELADIICKAVNNEVKLE